VKESDRASADGHAAAVFPPELAVMAQADIVARNQQGILKFNDIQVNHGVVQ
jgi:hypothetical protein